MSVSVLQAACRAPLVAALPTHGSTAMFPLPWFPLPSPCPLSQELLYNVQEQPAAGVHPRHICLELDPETQVGWLCAGLG